MKALGALATQPAQVVKPFLALDPLGRDDGPEGAPKTKTQAEKDRLGVLDIAV
jgi:hypothetical protein